MKSTGKWTEANKSIFGSYGSDRTDSTTTELSDSSQLRGCGEELLTESANPGVTKGPAQEKSAQVATSENELCTTKPVRFSVVSIHYHSTLLGDHGVVPASDGDASLSKPRSGSV